MCDQFTLHHKFRIDTGMTKFEQKTDGILHACGSYEQRTQRSEFSLTWMHRVLHGICRQRGRNIKTRCIGSISDLLKRKHSSSLRRDRTPSSFTIHSQPFVSRRLSRWKLEKSYTRKYMCHQDLKRIFPLKTIG